MGETLPLSPKTPVHNINRILDSLRARSRNAISRSFLTGCSTLVNQLEIVPSSQRGIIKRV